MVEVLVCIGLMSVLLAFVMPAVSAAHRESRAIVCQSNARQLAASLISYASQHKGRFPPNLTAPAPAASWADPTRLGRLLPLPPEGSPPGASVYVCPEDAGARLSYSMNLWASSKFDKVFITRPPQGTRFDLGVRRSSEMLLITEAWSWQGTLSAGYKSPAIVGGWGAPGKRFGGGGGLPPFSAGRWGRVNCELDFSRHRRSDVTGSVTQPKGRVTVGFADGHVELRSNESLVNFNSGTLSGGCFWSPLDRP